jgi:beta-barrel assembly-enhancing protease
MKFSRIFILVFICGSAYGQNFDEYKTLIPAGPIPSDFTEKTFVKVASEVKSLSRTKASDRRTRSTFYLESTFSIDDFLSGGSVLFNDQVSVYLQAVLDEVIRPQPHLRDKVRIYAVKSSVVNAFTTNNGIIFVNLGLLARLENEAQLAFIIAHEIVHYEKQHVLNAYIASVNIDRSSGDFRNMSVEDRNFAKSSYSKELESEADLIGSETFLKSGYAKDSINGIFEILKLADYPRSIARFEKRIFESGQYLFNDSLTRNTLAAYTINDDDYDDSKSSHPNIWKRREAVRRKLAGKPGGRSSLVSASEFNAVCKIANYELLRLYLLDHQFVYALNAAISLLQSNPSSDYVRESIAKSFYGIAKQKIFKEFDVTGEEWTGESVQLVSFVKALSRYETGILAMRLLSQCLDKNPENAELDLMLRDIVREVGREEDLSDKFFFPGLTRKNNDLPYPYTQYAFVDVARPSWLLELVRNEMKNIKREKPFRVKKIQSDATPKMQINVDKVVVVNPRYRKVDPRKKQRTRHVQAEKVIIDINEKIHASAGRLNLLSEILNTNTLTPTEVRTMQSNSILSDWLQEQFRSGDHRMVSPVYNEIVEVARTHKTDHFLWIGCASVIQKKRGKGFAIASAVLVPSLSPLSAAYLLAPRGKTFYFALLFNVRTQQLELSDIRIMSMKDSSSLLESNIYYTLFKVRDLNR